MLLFCAWGHSDPCDLSLSMKGQTSVLCTCICPPRHPRAFTTPSPSQKRSSSPWSHPSLWPPLSLCNKPVETGAVGSSRQDPLSPKLEEESCEPKSFPPDTRLPHADPGRLHGLSDTVSPTSWRWDRCVGLPNRAAEIGNDKESRSLFC